VWVCQVDWGANVEFKGNIRLKPDMKRDASGSSKNVISTTTANHMSQITIPRAVHKTIDRSLKRNLKQKK
jgi:hypothetical protein